MDGDGNEVIDDAEKEKDDDYVTFPYEKVIKKSNKRSLAWEFFEFWGKSLKEGPIEKEVYCKLCSCKVPYNSSTSNLLDHVRRKHESELIEAEKKSKEANKPKSDIRKFVISDSSNNNVRKWGKESLQWKTATEKLAKWCCKNNRPFSIVNDEGFIEFMNCVAPQYDLPSSANTVANYIDRMYDEEKEKLKEELKEVSYCAITTDGGSATNATSFQDINVHYLDKDLNLKSRVLSVEEVKVRHTADNLREHNDDILEDFDILEKISLTVTDNEPKMNKMYPPAERSGCMCHIEHSSISKGVEEVPEVKDVILKVRKIATKHNKSHVFKNTFEAEQKKIGLRQRPLIQDVVNRWGSTKASFESCLTHPEDLKDNDIFDNILAINSTIRKVVKKKFRDKLILTTTDQMFIENVHKLFTLLDVYTTTLGGADFVTCSIVIPVMKSMRNCLKVEESDPQFMIDLKEEIFAQFEERTKENLNFPVLFLCSALDPRFKRLKFIDGKNKVKEREDVFRKVLVEMRKVAVEQNEVEPTSTSEQGPSSKKRKLGLQYDESEDEDDEVETDRDPVKEELELYRKEPVLEQDSCPLSWWKERKHQYPTLIKLVQKYFCIPASSTQAERVFSKLGLIMTKRRLCLSSSHVDKMLFLGDALKAK